MLISVCNSNQWAEIVRMYHTGNNICKSNICLMHFTSEFTEYCRMAHEFGASVILESYSSG